MEQFVQLVDSMPNPVWLNSGAGASAGDSSVDNRCHSGFDNLADIHPQLSALEVRGRSL